MHISLKKDQKKNDFSPEARFFLPTIQLSQRTVGAKKHQRQQLAAPTVFPGHDRIRRWLSGWRQDGRGQWHEAPWRVGQVHHLPEGASGMTI